MPDAKLGRDSKSDKGATPDKGADGGQVVYSGPTVIKTGGSYTGNWESTSSSTAAVRVETSDPVVIHDCHIRSSGPAIWSLGNNANVSVVHCQIEGVGHSPASGTNGICIDIGNFVSLSVESNSLEACGSGIRILNYGGFQAAGQKVTVRYNRFHNLKGCGNAVGFNSVRQAVAEIAWNEVINDPFKSCVEDLISTYESSGTAASPIHIHDNFLRGGYNTDPALQMGYSGGMINLGDSPSKGDVGYGNVHHNQVVSFENTGIGISAGHDNEIHDNRIVSAQRLADGTILGGSWRAGLGVWDFYGGAANGYWHDNSAHDNYVNVVKRDGTAAGNLMPSLGGTVTETNNVNTSGHLATSLDEDAELQQWQTKLKSNSIVLGP